MTEKLRDLLGRQATGVSVVTVDVGGTKLGLTIGSLVSLSLDPALVGFSVAREAALHELVREARDCAISLLAAEQIALAQHFARGVPPIALWEGVATKDVVGAPLLAGALGWLRCRLREEVAAGTHTFFVWEVIEVELGSSAPALVRVRGEYASA